MEDFSRAVEVADMAVEATSQDHSDRAAHLNRLGVWLGMRFGQTGSMDDINRAIEVADMAVEATPQDRPDRAAHLSNLGILLGMRFERTDSMDDLDCAIRAGDMAVEATPQDHPDRAAHLSNLGILLGMRSQRTYSMGDLNRAVEVADMAVEATPQDRRDRAGYLSNLGNWLCTRFERTGSMYDLNRAVEVADMAVEATSHDHPDRAAHLSNLGILLGMRFERTDSMDDLNRAVKVADIAVEATSQDHSDRAAHLNRLGVWLGMRFGQTGSMDDLNRAVEIADMAVEATPQDNADRAAHLSNLRILLGMRFQRTYSTGDLNRAVEVADMAVEATPQDRRDRAGYLSNLGNWLCTRFERTGSMYDLNRAVEVADMAVEATSHDHPDRAAHLNKLGVWLGMRFEKTASMDDLNRAVEIADMAVEATPQDHPDRAAHLNKLGVWLGKRSERTDSMGDLNRAVEVADMAVEATPEDHPDRAVSLITLGYWLDTRSERTGSMDDLNRALSCYKKGWYCQNAPPSTRIHLAQNAAGILASQSNWEESSLLLQEAVKLLPTVSPRSLQHTDKQHMLADFAGLTSSAAATAINAGKEAHHALGLLELGRGVIAGLLLEMRTDVSELEQQHPELAKDFVSLRDELDSPANATALFTTLQTISSAGSRAGRRREAEKLFHEVLGKIRAKSGFRNYLLPPTAEELKAAADLGPVVVINVSSYRCDAFLVQQHRPVEALNLPNLRQSDIKEKTQLLRTAGAYCVQQTLEWLWDVAASPILDALGFKQPPPDDNWPHVWWILTGQLSRLPFHAAGRHFKGSIDTVLDRVISSYSPSIMALMYGHRHRGRYLPHQASENALLVTVPDSGLPFALGEMAMLEKLCPLLKLNPVKPAAHRDDILAHLRACKIFHFASHGQSNPLEPSESRLVLGGENNSVTVADLRDCRLQENPPFLAYLSACSTKVNEAQRLIDEEIHLVSACHLAGFRHVVGTLWEVSDKYCVDVARILYETIKDEGMTDGAVCRGLHRAIRALRDKGIAMNAKVNRDEQENGNQPVAKTTGVYDALNTDNGVTAVPEGTHQEKAEIAHDALVRSSNRNDTVNGSREQQKGELRQSHWGVHDGPLLPSSPLIWAAYIHAGL